MAIESEAYLLNALTLLDGGPGCTGHVCFSSVCQHGSHRVLGAQNRPKQPRQRSQRVLQCASSLSYRAASRVC